MESFNERTAAAGCRRNDDPTEILRGSLQGSGNVVYPEASRDQEEIGAGGRGLQEGYREDSHPLVERQYK